jgi:hypothetical protein
MKFVRESLVFAHLKIKTLGDVPSEQEADALIARWVSRLLMRATEKREKANVSRNKFDPFLSSGPVFS